MLIAFIVHDYPPMLGGIARYTADVVAFAARAWTVRVYRCGNPDGALDASHPIAGAIDPVQLRDRPDEVAARLSRDGVTHVIFNHIDLAGPGILRTFRRSGLISSTFLYGADIGIARPIRARLRLYRTAMLFHHRIVISRGTRGMARRRLPCLKTVQLLPGIDKSDDHHEEHSREKGRGIIAVGRFVRRKGFDTLLEAAGILARRGLHVPLTMVGDGPDREWLNERANQLGLGDRVSIRRGLDDAGLRAALRAHRVFCLLPRQLADGDIEGFGIVFLEAAREGLPVVAGNSGGVPDAVADGINGFLVDPLQPEDAARRLEQLLRDDALWDRMSRESLRWHASFRWAARDPRRELAFLDPHVNS